MLFGFILFVTGSILIAMHYYDECRKIQIGHAYRNREGKVVKIVTHRRLGDYDIFIGDDSRLYFDDGCMVGENFKNSPLTLSEVVKNSVIFANLFSLIRKEFDYDQVLNSS